MKLTRLLFFLFFLGFFVASCSKDDEPFDPKPKEIVGEGEEETEDEERNFEVEEFIYAGMNEIYLYKADIPELANDYFSTNTELYDFFKGFDTPEELYEGIQISDDRFSFMTADYVALENSFKGVSKTTGMSFGLGYLGDAGDVFGFVQYVLPNTPAEAEGVKRGDIFTKINGQQLTESNYGDLLASSSYTIDINYIEGGYITPTGESITMSKVEYTTDPVYITKTFDVNGTKVGYLMYNSFTASFDEQLNAAFGELKAAGVQELVLDLRYNGGGSVATAVGMAGMITGQFTGEVFLKEQWNEKYQNAWEPESYISRFRDEITLNRGTDNPTDIPLNSLWLDKVYVLTTGSTASASELVINGLIPHIDVIQIGTKTTGKYQASVTLYDSPGFGRDGANPNHTFAIQPLVMKSANAHGVTDYKDGLFPDIELGEKLANLGVLGDPNEPLLNAALNHIQGLPQAVAAKDRNTAKKFKIFGQSGMNEPDFQRMYIESLPQVLERN